MPSSEASTASAAAARADHRAPSPWRAIGRVLLAALLVLLAGEWLVRTFIGGPSAQVYDPEIGYSYLPHSEWFQAKEGVARLRFNALGLNDDEVAAAKGRCRVLVIGDSYTAALQLPREHNFTTVAERLDPGLDVVNGGRDGLFLGDLHKVHRRLAATVQPDLVVYVVSQRAVEADIHLPDFSVVVDPQTGAVTDAVMRVEDKEALKQTFGPVFRESALATRLAAQLQPTVVGAIGQVGAWRDAFDAPRSAQAAAAPAVAPPAPAAEAVLGFVFKRLAAPGPTALLYVNALQYAPGPRASVAPTSAGAERVARRAADAAGVRLYDTADALIASVAQTGQPPYGFQNAVLPGGHLNASGHRAVGRALVDLVRDMAPALPKGCGGA